MCVKWTTLCKPKGEGGLGIKDMTLFNVALGLVEMEIRYKMALIMKGYFGVQIRIMKKLDRRKSKQREFRWWSDLHKVYI